jgi:hypothetical protein
MPTILILLDTITLCFLAACWPGLARAGRQGLVGFAAIILCNLIGWCLW